MGHLVFCLSRFSPIIAKFFIVKVFHLFVPAKVLLHPIILSNHFFGHCSLLKFLFFHRVSASPTSALLLTWRRHAGRLDGTDVSDVSSLLIQMYHCSGCEKECAGCAAAHPGNLVGVQNTFFCTACVN